MPVNEYLPQATGLSLQLRATVQGQMVCWMVLQVVAQWPTSLDLWRGFLKSLLVCLGDRRAVGKQRLVLQKCSRL